MVVLLRFKAVRPAYYESAARGTARGSPPSCKSAAVITVLWNVGFAAV
jgi:hypothetical protein